MALKLNPVTGELDLIMSPGGGTATIQVDGDSGSATPDGSGVLTVAGGTGITTSAATSTVTVDLDSPVTVDNGGTGLASLTDGAVMVGDGTNAVELVGPLTDGQLLIGDTAGVSPVASTLTAGSGVSIVNAAGSITISATGGGFTWNEETGTSATMVVENGYIANNASLVTLTLPTTATVGQEIQIVGKGAGLFKVAQNASQTIHYAATDTTTGTGGSLTAIEQYASIELLCITENSDWAVIDSVGNFTIV
jgi:hypothetical protein